MQNSTDLNVVFLDAIKDRMPSGVANTAFLV